MSEPACRLSILVAVARNGVIGLRGELPWKLSSDLKRFKQLTLGHPVLMGRKTFDSIVTALGKPLPGRVSLVLSRQADDVNPEDPLPNVSADQPGLVRYVRDLSSARRLARKSKEL